jgi:hypothetical protein
MYEKYFYSLYKPVILLFTLHSIFEKLVTYTYIYTYIIIIISIQHLGQFLAGTRAQSGDRYGSGKLQSKKGLRGSLPLLSPTFTRSHSRSQMPPHSHQRERS